MHHVELKITSCEVEVIVFQVVSKSQAFMQLFTSSNVMLYLKKITRLFLGWEELPGNKQILQEVIHTHTQTYNHTHTQME